MKKVNLQDYPAVAFDFEGTLAQTIPTHHEARIQAFAKHGYGHITREQHDRGPIYGSSSADIMGGILHAAGEVAEEGPYHDHPKVMEVVATKLKLFEELAAKGFDEIPGAVAFVRSIGKQFRGHMAMVTSSPERFVTPFLERNHLAKLFPAGLIISHDTIIAQGLEGKPAPDAYKLAMHRLDAHGDKLLVFEDTVPGVVAAKKAGATVLALGFEPHSAELFVSNTLEYPPDFFVRDYDEARQLLGLSGGKVEEVYE